MKIGKIKGYCLVAAFTVVLYLGLNNLSKLSGAFSSGMQLMTPFMIGIVLAFIVNCIMRPLETGFFSTLGKEGSLTRRLCRPLSLACAYLLLIAGVSVLLTVVVPQLIDSISQLAYNIPGYLVTFQAWAEGLVTHFNLNDVVWKELESWFWDAVRGLPTIIANMLKSVPQLVGMVVSIGGGVLNGFIGLIVSIYILLSKEQLFSQMDRIVRAFLPQKAAFQVKRSAVIASETFSKYVSGKLLDSLIIGILSVLGLWLFRFPYALLIGVIMGITNIIPFFGPFIGAVPGFIILLIISPVKAFLYLIFVLVIQQFDGNILGPKIVGDSVGLPPIWVLFAVTVGGGLFGIAGMALGTPVFAVFYILFAQLVQGRLRERRESETPPPGEGTAEN